MKSPNLYDEYEYPIGFHPALWEPQVRLSIRPSKCVHAQTYPTQDFETVANPISKSDTKS